MLPLLKELSKPSIKPRHWAQVIKVTNAKIRPEAESEWQLQQLLDSSLLEAKEEIEDITEAADKQQKIEEQLKDISEYWATEQFEFQQWRGREVNCVLGGGKV